MAKTEGQKLRDIPTRQWHSAAMDNEQPPLPTDAELAAQIDAFGRKYLSPVLIGALEKHEDPLIVSLALMQQSFTMLQIAMKPEAGAIDFFEELAATFVRKRRSDSND